MLENAQGALLDIQQWAGPAMDQLRAMLAECAEKQVVGSAGQEAAAGAGCAQGQAGGAARDRADGTVAASSRDVEAAAGGAAAAPGGSGGGGGSGWGLARDAGLGGFMTNHFPAMVSAGQGV